MISFIRKILLDPIINDIKIISSYKLSIFQHGFFLVIGFFFFFKNKLIDNKIYDSNQSPVDEILVFHELKSTDIFSHIFYTNFFPSQFLYSY